MFSYTKKASLLASTMILGSLVATPVYAQEEEGASEDVGTIFVTGSRIARRADVNATSPLAVVDDEEFQLSGTVNVENVVNTLPQVIPGTTSFSNNPGGGVATLNLRGLGAQRTMVLVNGRRYMFYSTNQVVDLNTIPSFLLSGVEVVTGGGSAVYGSDALAGVVNFKLRDDLDGLEVGGQYSLTDEGDGDRYNIHGAFGTEFADNRGHVTVYGEYNRRTAVFQGDRDFSSVALGDNTVARTLVPTGSAGVPWGRFVTAPNLAIGIGSSCGTTPPRNAGCFAIGEGTNYGSSAFGATFLTPGVGTAYRDPQDSYNFAPVNYLMVPQERWMMGGYADYEITEGVTAYTEVSFINNRVDNELAATPITQNVDFQLSAITPFVSAADLAQLTTIAANQQAAIAAAATPGCAAVTVANPTGICANPFGAFTAGTGSFPALAPGFVRLQANTRFTQIGERNSSDERNAFRVLAGFKGEFLGDFNYDAYYMYARTRNSQVQEGNVSRSAFTRLAGNGTCNVFGLEQFSQACLTGVTILAQNGNISTLQVASANVSGPLFTLPTAGTPVAISAGVEWRSMGSEFIPDTALSSGDVAGFNAGNPTAGSYSAKEVFGELVIPVIEDNFIDSFEISGSFRYSDYSLEAVGGVWSYSGGFRLSPVQDVTFRGQYQRAIRAPNVGELFGGRSVGFPGATDPCSNRQPVAQQTQAVRDVCIATGVPAGSVFGAIQPNAQIQGAFGGNPDLEEETADTWTFGVVVQPSFLPGFVAQVDYYDITIEKQIAAAAGGVANILTLCYNTIQNANSAICQLIARDSLGVISGPPFVVTATAANLASSHAEGVDFSLDYTMPVSFGLLSDEADLSFGLLGTYTMKNDFTPLVDLPTVITTCAEEYGVTCGQPTPSFKWTSRMSFRDGPMVTSLRWRHLSEVRADSGSYVVQTLPAYDLIDLTFSFDATEALRLTAGVNNLFDTEPPILGTGAEQANTFPSTYDVLGRDLFVSALFRF